MKGRLVSPSTAQPLSPKSGTQDPPGSSPEDLPKRSLAPPSRSRASDSTRTSPWVDGINI